MCAIFGYSIQEVRLPLLGSQGRCNVRGPCVLYDGAAEELAYYINPFFVQNGEQAGLFADCPRRSRSRVLTVTKSTVGLKKERTLMFR